MGLSIIGIDRIPHYSLLANDSSSARCSIGAMMRNLLSYVSSVSSSENTVVELVFQKSESQGLRLFLTLRYVDGTTSVSAKQLVDSVMGFLKECNYSVKELVDKDLIEVVLHLRSQLSSNVVALCKSEKLISSSISYAGYYYYTDIFDNGNNDGGNGDNFNALLTYLNACNDATVLFQLIPTRLAPEECYALSNLSGELSATTQGIAMEQQMLREPSAEVARKTYAYYVERATQPIFVSNIVLSVGGDDSADGLISVLKNSIQSSLYAPVGIDAIKVANSSLLIEDFFKFPWRLQRILMTNYRNIEIWNGTVYQPTNLVRLPFLYSLNETTTFFCLPVDDDRVQGLRSNHMANDNEVINESLSDPNNIVFGKLIGDNRSRIGASESDFTRHTLIVGMPGSGKTTFSLGLLLQFYRRGVPFLAIEPTKTEYRALIDHIPDLQIFTPGKSSVSPFIINPFLPPKDIMVEQYIPSLMSAFRAAFSMESPLDVIFLRAIRQTYAKYGWKDYSCYGDPDVQEFGMFEFILEFKRIVSSSNYRAETKANIETGGTFRLMNLLDQNRYIYDTVHSVPIDILLEKPTVLELNAIADEEQKSLLMALLLIHVCLYVTSKGSSSGKLRNVLLIDEAHVLLDAKDRGPMEHNEAKGKTVKSLQKMIAEIRSFGTGVIIADQKPSKVSLDIVADTDIKIAFRLVEANERDIISNSMNTVDKQMQYLPRLKKGEAVVYFSGLESAKIISTPNIYEDEKIRYVVTDEEIQKRSTFWNEHSELLLPFYECTLCEMCKTSMRCNTDVRKKAEYYASHIMAVFGSRIRDVETLTKYMLRLDELILKYEGSESNRATSSAICNCSKIHFIRKVLLETDIKMSRESMDDLLKKTLIGGKNNE